MSADYPGPQAAARRAGFWFAWLFGIAVLATVVTGAIHWSEEQELVRSLERAQPWWLLGAVLLQSATYAAQGQIWRMAARAAQVPLSLGRAYRVSLAKLFVDQALPSGGLSGATFAARALELSGVPRGVVMASLVLSLLSYYAAYVLCLAAALVITTLGGHSNGVIVTVAILFIVFSALLAWCAFALTGRKPGGPLQSLNRLHFLSAGLELLRQADPKLVRSLRLVVQATVWQLVIVLLDAGTLWLLIRALGTTAPVASVFASFMIASLLRTVGLVPGGLGTFEAAAVFMLKLTGVPVTVALSAVLIFRGLSFWFPIVPGLLFSREALSRRYAAKKAASLENYWSLTVEESLAKLNAAAGGLSSDEAQRRLEIFGPNELHERGQLTRTQALLNQVRSPLLLLLVVAGAISGFTGEWTDAAVILSILVASVGIGYSREYRAAKAAEALLERVQAQATVLRDGRPVTTPQREVVPGDIVQLSAGSIVPADALVIEATDLFVGQGVLTGESFPVEKHAGPVSAEEPISGRVNCVFLGTVIHSGTARCLVVETGIATQFGQISHRLKLRPPQTEFDRGLARFGYLVTTAMFIMVLLVFAANVLLERPPIETLLFSIALAVGISPELLPAILSVNLAHGAHLMARHGVLVRHLNAIENLGSMDVLCTDKTGTLTEGVIRLQGAYDAQGRESADVLELASLNAVLQGGLSSPLDAAIQSCHAPNLEDVQKVAEIPYDFSRKRLSVVVRDRQATRIITKGSFEQILAVCTRSAEGALLDDGARAELQQRFQRWSGEGTRVLAVASRELAERSTFGRDDEHDLCFMGFVTFLDQPKEDAARAIAELAGLGVSVKLITGDNRLVAQHVAACVGLRAERVLSGGDLMRMRDEALRGAVSDTDLFVEVDPNQKERIILALRKMGHVVGFLGDGINDAPAMHAADTSLSVEKAADVAKQAADFVLSERHLDVIRSGVEEGRKTFANTLKYILTTMSANLGNMLSMAVASIFLPFLPLLAGQILLNNFLSDLPAIGLAGDAVDDELIARPRRWDIRFIGRFMVEFGILSSLFDFLTFAALVAYFAASPETFRTAWFVESLLTELFIALVVRTRRPAFRSRPGNVLLFSTVFVAGVALAIPYLPDSSVLGFAPLAPSILATVLGITGLYVVVTELAKAQLYRSTQA